MAHCVAARRRSFFNLLVEDRESFGGAGNLVQRTCEPNDAGPKQGHKLSQGFRGVPLRIDRYEDWLHIGRLISQTFHDRSNFGQGCRADIGAIGEAEKHQHPASLIILLRSNDTLMVGQLKCCAKSRFSSFFAFLNLPYRFPLKSNESQEGDTRQNPQSPSNY